MGDIEFWRTTTITVAALGQTLFVALYLTFPWYRSFLGRALFFKAVAFGVLLDIASVARLSGWLNNDALFVTLYGLLAVGIWVQLGAFIRTKRCGLRKALNGREDDFA
jgi:hypothetical protein